MAKGKTKVVYLGQQGNVQSADAPDYAFIYEASLTKHPNFNVGDVVYLPNGKGFVYCKSGGACYTGQGVSIMNAIPATGIDYSVLAETAPKGALSVKMTNQGTVAQTEDGLRGGTIILKPATDSPTNSALQMRGIIGNTAGGVSDEITIYLDAPLTAEISTSGYAFCMPSPYLNVAQSSNGDTAKIGPAAVYVSAANYYLWVQFQGRCWLAPQSGCGTTAYGREVVWRHDGSIQLRNYASAIGGEYGQVAGYIVDNNAAANGSTEIMLTGRV